MEIENGTTIVLSILGAIVGLVAVAGIFGHRQSRATLENWQRFAMQRGLNFRTPEKSGARPRMDGRLGDRAFAMFEVSISDGPDSNRLVTRMHLAPRGMPDGLGIHEKTSGRMGRAITKLALGLGGKMGARIPEVVQTGDPAFDQKWELRGFDSDTVRSWIESKPRFDVLLDVCGEKGFGTIDDGISWEGATPRTIDQIEAVVGKLEYFADGFEAS